jgi:thiosulfate/3-mercaptopyruvate sulfurtransferase
VIEPFVDIEWVEAHRDEVVLADCRWYTDDRSGRDAYDAGHISGAVFVDLDTALTRHADPAEAGRHPLATPEDFAAAMAALGIGDDDIVVAYDDAGGVIAARLTWMLRATDHEAALLDGGLQAWVGELETASPVRSAATFTPRPWPAERLVTIEDAETASRSIAASADARAAAAQARDGAAAGDRADDDDATAGDHAANDDAGAAVQLIDARPADRFAGAPDDLDPRAGHIPGARSVPCRENLDADGRLLPADELRDRFGVDDASEVISYCGSGVTACHNLLAMEQAGLGRGRLFPGSWSQWSRDPARPAETGNAGRP